MPLSEIFLNAAKAEADRAAAQKRVQEARAAVEKDSKARAELDKAQAERAAAEKRIKEAQAALVDAEIEAEKFKKEK